VGESILDILSLSFKACDKTGREFYSSGPALCVRNFVQQRVYRTLARAGSAASSCYTGGMDLVVWTYIFGGATMFGLIVAVFSVWNGRMTRRELGQVIEAADRRTQELIEAGDRRTQELIGAGDGRTQELIARIAAHIQEMDRRHTELLSEVLRRVL